MGRNRANGIYVFPDGDGMVSRYDIAMELKEKFHDLNWKGEKHTSGVYFDEKYGYMLERTVCVRMAHDEAVAPLYFRPDFQGDDDEVLPVFPYHDMSKNPNKYQTIFKERTLTPDQLDSLFHLPEIEQIQLPAELILDLLRIIPQKRERDRSWLHMKISGNEATATLFQKGKEKNDFIKVGEDILQVISRTGKEHGLERWIVNANSLLFALSLQSLTNCVLFSTYHGRIKITNGSANPKVEVVLSAPRKAIETEITRRL